MSEGAGSTVEAVADREDHIVWFEFHHERLPLVECITQGRGILLSYLASL
jgi:hypothetical protein